ncbi:paraquat-inducible protein A [Mariniblastus sp.]|nr:paraquat-inducible protein A [Mariniblastus sp.]
MSHSNRHLKACHCCGLVQEIPITEQDRRLLCFRCETPIKTNVSPEKSASRTAAAALGAFCLFWPAILMPILEVEQLGNRSQSSILSGIIELFQHGSYFVGGIVFLFSILFPLTKIVMLFELSCLKLLNRRHKAFTLRLMEKIGKWSMMDVMLLAFLVMLVKLGDLVEFQFGPAIVAFVGCVMMSMLASLCFDPHSIWDKSDNLHLNS